MGGTLQVRVVGMDGLGLEGGGGGRSDSWSASPFVLLSLPWASARARARLGPFQHNRVRVKRRYSDLFSLTAVAAETTPAIAEPSIVVARVRRGDSGSAPDMLGAPITRWCGGVDFSASAECEICVSVRDGAKEVGEARFLLRDFLAHPAALSARAAGGDAAGAFHGGGFLLREKKIALVHGAEQVRRLVACLFCPPCSDPLTSPVRARTLVLLLRSHAPCVAFPFPFPL